MDYRKQFVVEPGHRLCLKDIDPAYKGHHETHETAQPNWSITARARPNADFAVCRKKTRILIVLQALVLAARMERRPCVRAFNPQGASVTGFKQPTPWNSRMTSLACASACAAKDGCRS